MTDAYLEDAGDRLIVWNGNVDKRGALSPELYAVIAEAFAKAAEGRVRAVVLTSQGGFFCAGGDLNVLISRREMSETARRDKIDELHDLVRMIRASPVPVVAAVKGGAAGAGLSLALACDMIVAETGVKFTASYARAGLVPDGGLTAHLARMVPRQLAMQMCLMAQPVTAERLEALGVIAQLVDAEDVVPAAMALVDRIAAGPPVAQARIRDMVSKAYDQSEAAQLDMERDGMAWAAGADEAAVGIAAFLDKRTPDFSK